MHLGCTWYALRHYMHFACKNLEVHLDCKSLGMIMTGPKDQARPVRMEFINHILNLYWMPKSSLISPKIFMLDQICHFLLPSVVLLVGHVTS